MTDIVSQGKTCPNNVVELNNLLTHQSYYTALSRSATAKGTTILQGFDPCKSLAMHLGHYIRIL